jgi:hypothetical protein
VVASDTEGKWEPEDGYDWLYPNSAGDKSVRWMPNTPSTRHPDVATGPVEGQWRPADGYVWVINPHGSSGDMRVAPVNLPATSTITPSTPPFDQGLADRAALEQWVAGLSSEFRRGVDWWAARRSVANPGLCDGPAATSSEFAAGCEAAKARLTPVDTKRKSDPEYRRGWNTAPGTQIAAPSSAPAPGMPIPLINQAPSSEPPGSDADVAKKLNEQELLRVRGR